jgi:hypothetical protein
MGKDNSKSDKPSLQTTAPILTAQEMLSQGEAAARLLDSPVYNLAHRSVMQNLQDEWMETKVHEKEKREGLFQMVRGLSAVASEMAMMVEQAKMLGADKLEDERKLQLAYNDNDGFPGHTRRA